MLNNTISALIYTFDSQTDVTECIKSVKLLTNNILVIDQKSTDDTAKIAKRQGAVVIEHSPVNIVEEVREFGIEKVETEWVLILDGDERLTDDLVKEIVKIDPENQTYSHYKIPRKEFFSKKIWLKHGGWWPNHQIRLFKKSALIEWPKVIHSTPRFKGELGYLIYPLLHYSQNDWSDIVEKTIRFEDTESKLLFEAGRSVSTLTFFRKFLGELFRRLVKHRGFMDGQVGIIVSLYQAFSKTITYLYLYEKKKKSRAL